MKRANLPSAVSQENAIARPTKNADHGVVTRAASRPALADLKNHAVGGGILKRTGSLKLKTETTTTITTAIFPKPEPRRPLRSTTESTVTNNISLPTGKNFDHKAANNGAATRNALSQLQRTNSTASTSTLINNSSNQSTASVIGNSTAASSFANAFKMPPAMGPAGGRLKRQNATSNLHSKLTENSGINASNASAQSDASNIEATKLATTAEVAALHEALMLAPVKEEHEQLTEMPSQDAYSSAMMPNIDEGDRDNPQLVADYVNDIYDYLRKLEAQQGIREGFLQGKEVTGRMRTVLIDWLCQVHIRFHLMPETLYMTVMLIDRYLQAAPRVPKDKLQLVGTTALFIASKYEEMYAPEIGDLVYITDRSCKKEDIRAMEIMILRTLDFKIGRPLPIHFLRRYSKAADADGQKHTLAKYFLELALTHYPVSHFPPSIMAAAALWLSTKLLTPNSEWTPTLVHYTKYQEPDFMACVKKLCFLLVKTHTKEIKQQSIREKFATTKFMEISKHPCLDLDRIRKLGDL